MKQQAKKTRISLDCFPDEHVRIKIYATLHNKTISEYILGLVREGMSHERLQVPENNDTLDLTDREPYPSGLLLKQRETEKA